MFVCYE